ncbi:hypothetical protein HYZ41_04220 [archaeon]|nr:hypothetical protein [archaeon]
MTNKFIVPTVAGILIAVFIYANLYTSFGVEKGICNGIEDCKNLSHVQCTGQWICERRQCGWVCTSDSIKTGPGLSGATVECIDDSNCTPGNCPDNTTYKRYSCQANTCTEIKYFADPCKYR